MSRRITIILKGCALLALSTIAAPCFGQGAGWFYQMVQQCRNRGGAWVNLPNGSGYCRMPQRPVYIPPPTAPSPQQTAEQQLEIAHANANSLAEKGRIAGNDGNWQSAITYYQQALQSWPDNESFKKSLADAQDQLAAQKQREQDAIAVAAIDGQISQFADSLSAAATVDNLSFDGGQGGAAGSGGSGLAFMSDGPNDKKPSGATSNLQFGDPNATQLPPAHQVPPSDASKTLPGLEFSAAPADSGAQPEEGSQFGLPGRHTFRNDIFRDPNGNPVPSKQSMLAPVADLQNGLPNATTSQNTSLSTNGTSTGPIPPQGSPGGENTGGGNKESVSADHNTSGADQAAQQRPQPGSPPPSATETGPAAGQLHQTNLASQQAATLPPVVQPGQDPAATKVVGVVPGAGSPEQAKAEAGKTFDNSTPLGAPVVIQGTTPVPLSTPPTNQGRPLSSGALPSANPQTTGGVVVPPDSDQGYLFRGQGPQAAAPVARASATASNGVVVPPDSDLAYLFRGDAVPAPDPYLKALAEANQPDFSRELSAWAPGLADRYKKDPAFAQQVNTELKPAFDRLGKQYVSALAQAQTEAQQQMSAALDTLRSQGLLKPGLPLEQQEAASPALRSAIESAQQRVLAAEKAADARAATVLAQGEQAACAALLASGGH